MARQLLLAEQIHEPEPPRIVEGDAVPRVEVEHDVIVTIRLGGFAPVGGRGRLDAERSGHAQVNDQGVTR